MFELKCKRVVLTFDFSFFAVVSLMLLSDKNEYVILCLLVCIWHETGHLIAMLLNNVSVGKIGFYGGGIRITPVKPLDFTSSAISFCVLLAGSTLNFVTFFVLKNCSYNLLSAFAAVNAIIGAFNMLPLQFLDGGKILVLIIRNICSYQQAVVLERYLKWINVALIVTVIIIFSFIGKGNITLFVTLCCLLLSAISDS